MQSLRCLIFSFLLLCLSSRWQPAAAHLIFLDEFNDDALKPEWQIKKISGIEFLLTRQPGKLFVINKSPDSAIVNANSTTLGLDPPPGDFSMETQITENNGNCGGECGPTLFVTFDTRDTIAWTYAGKGAGGAVEHLFTNTQLGGQERVAADSPPFYLRLRRTGDKYTFEGRLTPADEWVAIRQMSVQGSPVKIGLMFPMASCGQGRGYSAALGYFRVDDAGKPPASKSYKMLKLQCALVLPGTWLSSAAFAPDGQTVAAGTGLTESAVREWDAASTLPQRKYTGHGQMVNALTYSPDGKLLASASNDGTVRLWDTTAGRTIWSAPVAKKVFAVTFSPDGKSLAACGAVGGIKVFDSATGALKREWKAVVYDVYSIAFSPDGQKLASAGQDGIVKLWDVSTGALERQMVHNAATTAVVFSRDGKWLCTGDTSAGKLNAESEVRIWEVATGNLLNTLPANGGSVLSLAVSPDGTTLASGGADGILMMWDLPTGALLHTLPAARSNLWSVSFAPDGNAIVTGSGRSGRLCTGGDDGEVRIWRVPQ